MAYLSKNNVQHQKADTLTERISNMGSWLLDEKKLKTPSVAQKLAKESSEISNTNKSQKGVLLDHLLVQGICHLTQLDYYKQPNVFKIVDLNASRTFSSQVSWLLVYCEKY